MQRSKIKEIFNREQSGGEVLVQGWVKTRRSSKSVTFIQITKQHYPENFNLDIRTGTNAASKIINPQTGRI